MLKIDLTPTFIIGSINILWQVLKFCKVEIMMKIVSN